MDTNPASAPAPVKQETITVSRYKKWIIPLFLVAFIQLLVMVNIFARPEMIIYDSWFRLKGVQNPGEQVVVIAIDDESVGRIGPLAWPRTVHAALLEKLAQARVVGFDLTFAAEKDAQEDLVFADAIARHGRVVLASKLIFTRDDSGEMMEGLELPLGTLMQGCSGIGFVNTPVDADQVVRRLSMVDVNLFDIPFPSFALATYLVAEGLNPTAVNLIPGFLEVNDQKIPINAANQAMPTFYGPTETFKTISYADVIQGDVSPDYFKDKIVLIGAATAEDHDVYATPYSTTNMVKSGSRAAPGVEIHANTVQSFLSSSWYSQVGSGFNFIFLLVMALLTTLVVSGRGPWVGLMGTLGVVAISLGTVYYLWFTNHLWLNLAAPLAIIFLTYVVVTAADFITAEMQRRKTKAMFSRYVSPEVVDELMANPEQMALGGKKQIVTIMFTDIRGFTAFSENKDPVDVISRLNEYLTAQTDAIMKHGGTLDKYMGDGLMAFFGAPVYYPDHVERAVKVAREIQEKVAELNKKWAETGDPPLLIAVGVNTGPVVVGNVGSPERMDYTLIGEDANLASRVEALTKLFETLVLVSERSYNLLPEGEVKDSLSYIGEELVKGFTNPIKVYTFTDMNLHFEKSKDKGFK
ncbi:MAG: adenylate/guanylate cyclase domain-containing protein [Syntrophomonas sp.]|nr:adenylate/guanylate cyclase domain-containing protein [Syntrophomonas sp.]